MAKLTGSIAQISVTPYTFSDALGSKGCAEEEQEQEKVELRLVPNSPMAQDLARSCGIQRKWKAASELDFFPAQDGHPAAFSAISPPRGPCGSCLALVLLSLFRQDGD